MEPFYATVQQLQAAADFKPSAYEADRLSRILDASSRRIERQLHRHFYPVTEAVTYTRPRLVRLRQTDGTGIWLERDLQSLTSVVADDVIKTVSQLDLYPSQYGPPYSWLQITGNDIVITGVWGYSNDTTPAGALEAAVSDTTGTTVDITDSSVIGVGDLIIIDSERMVVTARTNLDTTQNIGGNLLAATNDQSVGVTDGTAYHVGETITVNSEDMLTLAIASNTLTVKRAWGGSVIAAHSSGDDIYAPRTLTVERAATGTTAATHADAATITRNLPPGVITELCIAEALNTYAQETSAYARTIGADETAQEAKGLGLREARRQAKQYQRSRMATI